MTHTNHSSCALALEVQHCACALNIEGLMREEIWYETEQRPQICELVIIVSLVMIANVNCNDQEVRDLIFYCQLLSNHIDVPMETDIFYVYQSTGLYNHTAYIEMCFLIQAKLNGLNKVF